MRDNSLSPFERLDVWHSAVALTTRVYQVTASYPQSERFGLVSQTCKASVSVVANLAEGSSRHGSRSFAHFSHIAYGSLREVEALLIVASKLHFLTQAELVSIRAELSVVSRQLHRLILALNKAAQREAPPRQPADRHH
jgi:four helix bundle protein